MARVHPRAGIVKPMRTVILPYFRNSVVVISTFVRNVVAQWWWRRVGSRGSSRRCLHSAAWTDPRRTAKVVFRIGAPRGLNKAATDAQPSSLVL